MRLLRGFAGACGLLIALISLDGCGASAAPAALHVPPGFHLTIVSSRVTGARFIALAPNGDVIVSETAHSRVVALSAGSAPDQAPRVILSGVPLPHGLAFRGNELYVATWSGVQKGRYSPSAAFRPATLFDDLPESGDHNDRALAVAPDGRLFVSSGSDCDVCVEMNARMAAVLRYDADGSHGSIYSSGLRNASGLAFDRNGILWAVVNQRDNIGPTQEITDNLPPDQLVRVRQNANYGWPYCYPTHHTMLPNPEFKDAQKCVGTEAGEFEFQAHSAPLGIAFYEGQNFPQRYRGAAFVAFHGSWNRSTPSGDKVMVVFFKDGRPQSVEDFVTGWLQPDGSFAGRPVGIAVAPDGSLYISDDSGFIYRVRYGG